MAFPFGRAGITRFTTTSNASNHLVRFLFPAQRSKYVYSVLETDKEGYDLWKKLGLSDDKIVKCGVKDNFWSMGDGEGPCGPCTEIFWDTMDDTLDER